jgi:F0F1-type ATP synthase membrane subunit b/b'
MNTGGLILIVGSLAAAAAAFIWLAFKIQNGTAGKGGKDRKEMIADAAAEDVEHIFNDDFREELRNRGRLHFEKIITDNAVFLQQDLRNTTTQLNEYMRTEISKTLQEEFKKYEQSIVDAKQIALDSIEKTVATIEQQRQFLEQQMKSEADAQKKRMVERFEGEMATIVNHYVLQAIGSQIDVADQMDFILAEMQANKQAIIEDIQRGTT